MAISILQSAKNSTAYQVNPLVVSLKTGTTANSMLAVVVEAQKTGNPYNFGTLGSHTPAPTVKDSNGVVYTLVDSIVNQSQELNGKLSPDAAAYFPSLYFYVSPGVATTGMKSVSVSAFYPDEVLSPPVQGRPVFDGGLNAQVFEIGGLSSHAVDAHAHGSANNASLGPSLITTSGAAIIFEVGVLLDSSSLVTASSAVGEAAGIIYGGSSHYVVQATIVGGATASAGFKNGLRYTGAVVAVSLK